MKKKIILMFCLLLIMLFFSSVVYAIQTPMQLKEIKKEINIEYNKSKKDYLLENKNVKLINDDKLINSTVHKCSYNNNDILCMVNMEKKYTVYLNGDFPIFPFKMDKYNNNYLIYFKDAFGYDLHIGGNSDVYDLQQNHTYIFEINLTTPTGLNCTLENLTCAFVLNNTDDAIISWKINNTPQMSAYFPFESNETIALKDFSGNNLSCKNNNAVLNNTKGFNGKTVFLFNESQTTFLNCSLPTVFNDIPNNDFSIALWFYVDNFEEKIGTWTRIFDFSFDNDNFAQIVIVDNNVSEIIIEDAGTQRAIESDFFQREKTWYFAVVTWDASTNDIDYFINASEQTNIGFTGASGGYEQRLRIGSRTDDDGLFTGRVDELRVYDYILSQEKITSLYKNQTKLILSSETTIGETWQCEVFPYNISGLGISNVSNNLTIIPVFPIANIINPLNNSIININYTKNGTINYTCGCFFETNNYTSTVLFDDDIIFKGDFNNTEVFINYFNKSLGTHNITLFCNITNYDKEQIQITLTKIQKEMPLFDITDTPTVLFLGFLAFLFIGLLAIGLLAKNIFVSFLGLVIGVFIGIIMLSIYLIFGVILLFLNVALMFILIFTNEG